MKVSFIDVVDGLYAKRNTLYEFMTRTGRIHPSQIHEQCKRRTVLELMRVIPSELRSNDRVSNRIFDTGHSLHTLFQWYAFTACKLGDLEWCEIESPVVSEELMIDGRSDIEYKPVGGSEVIMDLKTIKAELYSKLRSPYPKHITQVQIYMHVKGVDDGLILYHNKNTHVEKEFHIKRDSAYVKPHIDMIKDCVSNFKAGTIPNRSEYKGFKLFKGDPACSDTFCPYRAECLKGYEDSIDKSALNFWDGKSELPGCEQSTVGTPPVYEKGTNPDSGGGIDIQTYDSVVKRTPERKEPVRSSESSWKNILEVINAASNSK